MKRPVECLDILREVLTVVGGTSSSPGPGTGTERGLGAPPSPGCKDYLPLPFPLFPYACERSLPATLFAAGDDFGLERIFDARLASFLLVAITATSFRPRFASVARRSFEHLLEV